MHFSVVGLNKVPEYAQNLNKLLGGLPNTSDLKATLVPEPTNPYDSRAIKVLINDLQIGYIGRRDHDAIAAQAPQLHNAITNGRVLEIGYIWNQDSFYAYCSVEV